MSDLTFYTHPMSRGRVVRWMLEEVGADYTVKTLEFGGDMKGPEYLAINPMGKVPAIKHGDVVVTEVAAICAWRGATKSSLSHIRVQAPRAPANANDAQRPTAIPIDRHR